MHTNELLNYEEGFLIVINEPKDKFYYKFDYDSRNYNVNMEFQHFHHYYEIFILIDQCASHIIEGKLYEIKPFDIVALKKNVLHKTVYPKGSPKKRLIINFILDEMSPSLSSSFSELLRVFEEPLPIFRFPEDIQKILFNLLNEIFYISNQKDFLNKFYIHHKFMEFMYHLYHYRQMNSYTPEEIQDTTAKKIYSITAFIHNHYSEKLTLKSIAEGFYISPFYLSHQFKHVTGYTLTHYIQITRVRNAQQLLHSTNIKITDISEKCGFSSFSQFNRVFRKFTKTSPSEYRSKAVAKNKI